MIKTRLIPNILPKTLAKIERLSAKGITKAQIASKMGVHAPYLYRAIADKYIAPKHLENLIAVVDELSLTAKKQIQ